MARFKYSIRIGRGNITRFESRGEAIEALRRLVMNKQVEPLLFAMEEVRLCYNGRLEKLSDEQLLRIMESTE